MKDERLGRDMARSRPRTPATKVGNRERSVCFGVLHSPHTKVVRSREARPDKLTSLTSRLRQLLTRSDQRMSCVLSCAGIGSEWPCTEIRVPVLQNS